MEKSRHVQGLPPGWKLVEVPEEGGGKKEVVEMTGVDVSVLCEVLFNPP